MRTFASDPLRFRNRSPAAAGHARALALLAVATLASACGSSGGAGDGGPGDGGAGGTAPPPGGTQPPAGGADAMNMDAMNMDAAPLPVDMYIEPDLPPEPDFPLPDVPPPDVPPPLTDLGVQIDFGEVMGPACDPRLRAAACEPGFYCVHEEGRPEFIGRCAPGDGCTPGDPATCPDPARPYCHLVGGATFCTEVGINRENDDCVDRAQQPQACAAGLACTFSTCRTVCNPAEPVTCAENWRCESYEGATGEPFGICQPPACDWFTARGCQAGEKCAYSIRGDGQVVGSCRPLEGPGNGPESPCGGGAEGGDNCAVGLVCTGPPGSQRLCKILCDTGGYQAPCPDGLRCVEALATGNGPVRGLGICITNQ